MTIIDISFALKGGDTTRDTPAGRHHCSVIELCPTFQRITTKGEIHPPSLNGYEKAMRPKVEMVVPSKLD